MFRFASAFALFAAYVFLPRAEAQTKVVDFEDLVFTQPGNYTSSSNPQFNGQSYDNGITLGTAGFTSGGATFNTGPYEGWLYSNVYDPLTAGFTNESGAYTAGSTTLPAPAIGGNGAGGSKQFAVGYYSMFATQPAPSIDLPAGYRPSSVEITNNTYAALAMRDGYFNSRKFTDGDFLILTITGRNANGVSTGSTDFALGDFRDGKQLIVDRWTTVDLKGLGADTVRLEFSVTGSDNDPTYGLNTPAYFAVDNLSLVAVPEPAAVFAAAVAVGAMVRFGRRKRTLNGRATRRE